MAFSIRPGFRRTISVAFTKADGSAGSVEGAPTWELSDQTLALITPTADGMSVDMQHNGAVGDVVLTLRADGDLGAGAARVFFACQTQWRVAPMGGICGLNYQSVGRVMEWLCVADPAEAFEGIQVMELVVLSESRKKSNG